MKFSVVLDATDVGIQEGLDFLKRLKQGFNQTLTPNNDTVSPPPPPGPGAGDPPGPGDGASDPPGPGDGAGTTVLIPTADLAGGFDADGIPWDSRIHSGGKVKTPKGYWKKRKNCPDTLLLSVKAELLKAFGPNAEAGDPPGPGAGDPPGPEVVNTSTLPVQKDLTNITFAEAVQDFVTWKAHGHITEQDQNSALTNAGLSDITQLINQPIETLQKVYRSLEAICNVRKSSTPA